VPDVPTLVARTLTEFQGIIPKEQLWNIDLYVPFNVTEGAVHTLYVSCLPHPPHAPTEGHLTQITVNARYTDKGTAKIAKELGVIMQRLLCGIADPVRKSRRLSHAHAGVVEFKNRKATPIIRGIVIASKQER